MPPDGRRHTAADVARSLSSCDSDETVVAVKLSLPPATELPVQSWRIAENNKIIQSRRLALRAYEIVHMPRLLGARVFHLSKWLLRHFFHRKEFRRKGISAAKMMTIDGQRMRFNH